jgi:hypothetical protein
MRAFLVVPAALPIKAQRVSSIGTPKDPNPPVIFLNGYQADCKASSSGGTFGAFTPGAKPSIEELGNLFGLYLASLRYIDGTPVPVVHIAPQSFFQGSCSLRCKRDPRPGKSRSKRVGKPERTRQVGGDIRQEWSGIPYFPDRGLGFRSRRQLLGKRDAQEEWCTYTTIDFKI